MELYKKYRPKSLKELVGQDEAVAALTSRIKKGNVPHAIMFTGPSGTGKTTCARILRDALKCSDLDFVELNCADFRGIDVARDIRSTVRLHPVGGESRVWLIDEAHMLTKEAQNAFLKTLEDTPAHAYFILCTTEPEKLLPTVRTRCTVIGMKPLDEKQMAVLLNGVLAGERATVSEGVYDRLIEIADGSARKALVLLEQALSLKGEAAQLNVLVASDTKQQVIAIARALTSQRPSWRDVAKVLKGVTEEPETVRRMVLGYFNAILLGGGKLEKRAAHVIGCLRDNVFDSGKAGLSLSLWEACQG